ncbi:MAG: hypothetical protein BROFUL_02311 [Candidatus Brocadia fulgida]|uniref:Uncharacterized protein n=1 Tax=Candidatus Brocadia fulgida TaxID=380242 RepID=A0A0M2UT40_9BACT|nr:MAG: hypothetical protein BROFUL_02311 [Candidatus Brocadia fulgida]
MPEYGHNLAHSLAGALSLLLILCHNAAQPQPNFLYESGEIASEKELAMTATMHFDGTRHVVIASEAKQSFTHKKRYLLKGVCEKTYKKRSFYGEIL